MRRILKWLGYLALTLAVLALCGVAAVYAVSEYKLRRFHDVPPVDLDLPTDPESLAEGGRLAQLRGCYRGCHADLEGRVFFDEPWLIRLAAPNLTKAAAQYSTEEFVRIVRYGVRPDGTTTTGMPSDMFYYLSDEDLARIIAFMESADPKESDLPDNQYRIVARLMIVLGKFEVDAERVAALGPRPPVPDPGPTSEYGKYLAMTNCTECHGMRLEGGFMGQAPALSVVKSYSREQFGRLIEQGVAIGDRELGTMASVSRSRFSRFTDQEVDALYAFLQDARLPLQDEGHLEAARDDQ